MNRRFLIIAIIGATALAIVGGLLIWAVKAQNRTKTPVVVAPQVKKISTDPVISPIPAANSQGIWYFNSYGRLFRINLDGSGLTEYPLPAQSGTVRSVWWPTAG